jgi:high-affinity Fe2+/Pb2+ permease
MPRSQAGVAAATASTSRQIGTSLGVAISGTLVVTTAKYGPVPTDTAWYMIIGYGALVLLLGLITTGQWAHRSAARIAERLEESDREPAR